MENLYLNNYPITETKNAMSNITMIPFKRSKLEGSNELEGIFCQTDNSFYRVTFDAEIIESKQFPGDFDFADFEISFQTVEKCHITQDEYKPCNFIEWDINIWLKAKCETYFEEEYFYDEFIRHIEE